MEIRKIINKHKRKYNKDIKDNTLIIRGTNNIMISAPHAFLHLRDGKKKTRDHYTATISRILSHYTKCHFIYITSAIDYDPNYDAIENNPYLQKLKKYIQNNKIDYLIELHGFKNNLKSNIDIGVNSYNNVNGDKKIVDLLVQIFKSHGIKKVTVDCFYKGGKNTISNKINRSLKTNCLQIEMGIDYRDYKKNMDSFKTLIASLISFIETLEKRTYEKSMDTIF